jgi:hypothetical protein
MTWTTPESVTFNYHLSWKERLKALFFGKVKVVYVPVVSGILTADEMNKQLTKPLGDQRLFVWVEV